MFSYSKISGVYSIFSDENDFNMRKKFLGKVMDYSSLKLDQLKKLTRERQIRGRSGKNKGELIILLQKWDDNHPQCQKNNSPVLSSLSRIPVSAPPPFAEKRNTFDKNFLESIRDKPIIFLDIDGVLNAHYPRGERASVFIPTINHPDKHFSKTVVAHLNSIHRRSAAEIRWLTAWEGEAVTIFAPSVGLDKFKESFHLPDCAVWPYTKRFFVSQALNLEPNRSIIWIDDEATLLEQDGFKRGSNLRWGHNRIKEELVEPQLDVCKLYKTKAAQMLCIAPDPCYGLSLETFDLIETFLLENSVSKFGDEVPIIEAKEDPDFIELFGVYTTEIESEKRIRERRPQYHREYPKARTITPEDTPIIREWDGKDRPPDCTCNQCLRWR